MLLSFVLRLFISRYCCPNSVILPFDVLRLFRASGELCRTTKRRISSWMLTSSISTPGIDFVALYNNFFKWSRSPGFKSLSRYFVTQTTWYCTRYTLWFDFLTSTLALYQSIGLKHSPPGMPGELWPSAVSGFFVAVAPQNDTKSLNLNFISQKNARWKPENNSDTHDPFYV